MGLQDDGIHCGCLEFVVGGSVADAGCTLGALSES